MYSNNVRKLSKALISFPTPSVPLVNLSPPLPVPFPPVPTIAPGTALPKNPLRVSKASNELFMREWYESNNGNWIWSRNGTWWEGGSKPYRSVTEDSRILRLRAEDVGRMLVSVPWRRGWDESDPWSWVSSMMVHALGELMRFKYWASATMDQSQRMYRKTL